MDARVTVINAKFPKRSLFLFFTQEKAQLNPFLSKPMVSFSLKI